MAKKSSIHELIHSLDTSEKRYFNQYATRSGKKEGKQYLKLFNAIGKQKQYDEARLLKHFEGDPIVRHFAVTKNYLYAAILDALKELYRNGNIEVQLLNLLNQIIILHRKGLYLQALKLNKKGLNLAKKNGLKFVEHHFFHYNLILWRDSESLKHLTDDLDEVWNGLNDSIGEYQNQLKLDYINTKRLYTMRKGFLNDTDNKESIAWISMVKNMTEKDCHTKNDLSKYLQAKMHLAEIEGKHEEMFQLAKRGVENELVDMKIPTNIVISHQNILTKSVRFMYYEEMPFYIQQLRDLSSKMSIKKQEAVKIHANIRADAFEITYFFQTNQKEACLQLMNSYSMDLMKYQNTDSFIWQLALNSTMSLYLWNYGQLSDAHDKVNYVLNQTNPSVFPKYQLVARFVFLGIHFENKSNRLFQSMSEKIERYIKKENINTPLCKKILSTFRKLDRAADRTEREKIIGNFELDSQEDRVSFDVFSGYRDLANTLILRIKNKPKAS